MVLKKQSVIRKLICHFRQQEKKIDKQSVDHSWKDVETRAQSHIGKRLKRRWFISVGSSVAAAVLLLFLFLNRDNDQVEDKLSDFKETVADWKIDQNDRDDILLVLSEEKKINVTDTMIQYSKEGAISLSTDQIENVDQDVEMEYNKLYIPNGKRIQLVLSDGSKLWVNSGTKVVFPRKFTQKTREIFIDGEILIDVTPNPDSPFIVKTTEFDVLVKGTTFNVCTYMGMESSVVLVDGLVNIKNAKGLEVNLNPNELITINSAGFGDKKTVNTEKYTAWIDNLMLLEAEPLERVCYKLTQYYGVAFSIDESAKRVAISGKLDLKDDIENIVQNLSKTAPISYSVEKGVIYIQKNEK